MPFTAKKVKSMTRVEFAFGSLPYTHECVYK